MLTRTDVVFVGLFYISFFLLLLSNGSDMLAGVAIGMSIATVVLVIHDMIVQYVKMFNNKKGDDE